MRERRQGVRISNHGLVGWRRGLGGGGRGALYISKESSERQWRCCNGLCTRSNLRLGSGPVSGILPGKMMALICISFDRAV
jgi:hypothetical protein